MNLPTFLSAALLVICWPAFASQARHGFSYFGELKYPADVAHFDYVNPDAPKGGTLKVAEVGTFTSLHPFVDKGITAFYIDPRLGSVIYEKLMVGSEDETGTYYCRLAESIEVADDYSWVQYKLRDNAHWHDGSPVTIEDVLWTFDVFKNRASISFRSDWQDVERIEQTGPRSFKFHFSASAEKNGHLIIQTGLFAPLPKHYWAAREFDATTLEPPLGSGPYRVAEVDPGHRVVFERVADYWARDLNFTRGMYNFDRIELTYFFDKSVMLQALRAGVFDFYREQNEKFFHTAYDFPASRQGLFKTETYTMGTAYGMHEAVVFNLRRTRFQDVRVREALTLAYNFEWANRVYWHGGLARNNSYFVRSGLQAEGMPSQAEIELLEPFRSQLPARVFTDPIELPVNPSSGRNRKTLIAADALLREAGWVVRDFERVNEQSGEPLRFEFVIATGLYEQMLTPYIDNLKRLGIHAVLRKVENNLMVNRLRSYDFDVTIRKFYTYTIPFPNRLRGQFTSQYADPLNMINYAGIKNPVVDHLVEQIARASTREEMNTAGRALDRVLIWNFYMIPDGHPVGRHLLYWDRFGHPPLGAEHMNWTGFPALWWLDSVKNARVDAALTGGEK
jgi:microcin C transport system substrate-binding protein